MGGMDIGDAQDLAEMQVMAEFGTQQEMRMPTTEDGWKAYVAADAARQALRTITANPTVSGKTQGLENIFKSLTGTADAATAFETQLESMRTMIMTALGGANLPPAEIARFESFIPKVTDSPQKIQQNLEYLIPVLDTLTGTTGGGQVQSPEDFGDLNSVFY